MGKKYLYKVKTASWQRKLGYGSEEDEKKKPSTLVQKRGEMMSKSARKQRRMEIDKRRIL